MKEGLLAAQTAVESLVAMRPKNQAQLGAQSAGADGDAQRHPCDPCNQQAVL